MDAGLLDVLHDGGDVGLLAVAQRVDVDLDRVLEEAVDEDAARRVRHRRAHVLRPVADAHRAPAEDVRGTNQHGVPDAIGDRDRLVRVLDDPPLRAADPEPVEERAEALAILGQVDRLVRRAEDAEAGVLELARELERRLAAELDDDALRPLALADRQHFLDAERLEVEAVGGVVVGGDGLGVAVDHHRLAARARGTSARRGRSSSRTRCPGRSGSGRSRG